MIRRLWISFSDIRLNLLLNNNKRYPLNSDKLLYSNRLAMSRTKVFIPWLLSTYSFIVSVKIT
jgi:hypothetical protein